MKLYSISKQIFWVVMILITLLPLGRHWRLFSFGERSTGTVLEYSSYFGEDFYGEKEVFYASKIQFNTSDGLVEIWAPTDAELKMGREVPVFYQAKDPSKNCILNFACLYTTSYSILPLILIFVWWAFYLSYNNYHKEKKGESRTPASSPYVPFRRSLFSPRTRGNTKQ